MSKPHPKPEIGRGGLGCKADISSHFGRSSLDDGNKDTAIDRVAVTSGEGTACLDRPRPCGTVRACIEIRSRQLNLGSRSRRQKPSRSFRAPSNRPAWNSLTASGRGLGFEDDIGHLLLFIQRAPPGQGDRVVASLPPHRVPVRALAHTPPAMPRKAPKRQQGLKWL